MTAVQLHGVIHPRQALLRELVARIRDPTVGLHQHRRAQVVLRIPPVGGARRHATSAKDALVHTVQLGPVLAALEVLLVALLLHVLALQPRLDGLVLVVEVREVRHQVLDHVAVRQRLDLDRLRARFNVQEACQAVFAVDVHGAGTADAFAARTAERERRIDLVLDLDEGVKDHWPACFQVNGVLLHERLTHLVRVVAVDPESLRLHRGRREGAPAGAADHATLGGHRGPKDGRHCSLAGPGVHDESRVGEWP
mmetsp:Transcript_103935/g.299162  ORF Transcript_103935/g.299162 Transcript_103935/m.299162 type:complete len:253 (-) Transcript_103935:25-783(-)